MTQGLGLFLLPLSLKDGGLGPCTTSGLLFLAKAYAGADLENMDQRHHPIKRGFVLNATRRATECPMYEKSPPGLYPPWYANKRAVVVPELVGKEFPDVMQNERRIKFIRAGFVRRAGGGITSSKVGQLPDNQGEPTLNVGL